MKLEEIKSELEKGNRVFWKSQAYEVIKDSIGQYLIAWNHGGRDANYIGLTWRDGVTMNGKEGDFFGT